MIDLNLLIGKTELEARKLVNLWGLSCRVSNKDGIAIVGTCDFKLSRINLEVKNNKVIDAYRG